MQESGGLIVRWIVAFLVIFLLCMVFVFSTLKRVVPAGDGIKTRSRR